MRVPLSWLRDYVDITLPLEELSERLTLGGLEVGGIDRVGQDWQRDAIFVGQVVSVRQHPNADRLVLVTVEYGAAEPLEVVTGAPNLHVGDAGQKVVFATVGARLIDGHSDTLRYQTLKKSKIRGVDSVGMVCSEKELGLSDAHEGILILPDDAPVGTPLVDYMGDVVLDLDLTPNLARCFSVTGVAREAAALTGAALHLPTPTVGETGAPIAGRVDIEIADPDLCRRYSAALITGVTLGPSPQWMQRRLLLAGMRPINNIVDITNYVMLEWGQPLHAFDYNWLRPRTPGGVPAIIVRRAHPGEKITTLDGEEHTLGGEMLLITDGGGPVGVAGIMGGLDSEVKDTTVDVLLEAANFDNISVRRTAAGLHIPSEAAQRFGRGVDPALTLVGLRQACELMRTLAGGTVAEGFADLYPRPYEPPVIDFRVSEVERLLGVSLSAETVAEMLTSLGFTCEVAAGAPAVVRTRVPSFRLDVTMEADLVEEVARIYGYDRLPVTLMADALPTQRREIDLELEEKARDVLVGAGLTETITYALTNLESVGKLRPDRVPPSPDGYLKVLNPLTREQEYLRQTLMNAALDTAAANLRFVERVAVFEIAHIYLLRDGAVPEEPRRLSVTLAGAREVRSWLTNASEEMDYYDLKGVVETLCDRLGIADVAYAPVEHPTFRPGRAASLTVGGRPAGVLGEVHPLVAANFGLECRVCLAELDLEVLLATAQPVSRFTAVSRMPTLKEDLAVVVEEATPVDAVEAAIREAGGALLIDVVLFDVYRGPQLGAGKKSLAYNLTFQAPDRTLTSEEAAHQRERIVKALAHAFEAQIRS